jgi:hypothetical protein
MGLIGTPQLQDDNAEIDDQYIRTYHRSYLVYSTIDVDSWYVRNNSGISIAETHPNDSQALCKRISVKLASKQMGVYDSINNPAGAGSPPASPTSCYVWNLEVEWGLWNPQTHTSSGDPAETPLRVFFESQVFQEICDLDQAGNPIVNSAGSPFDPPPMRDVTRPIIRVVQLMTEFSDSTILAYSDKINSDVVGYYPVHTLKCQSVTAEERYSQFTGAKYYAVTFILAFKVDTWDLKLVDAGYEQLVSGSSTTRQKILDQGIPLSAPGLLNGSGAYLEPPVSSSHVAILTFQIYDAISYASAFDFPSGTFN